MHSPFYCCFATLCKGNGYYGGGAASSTVLEPCKCEQFSRVTTSSSIRSYGPQVISLNHQSISTSSQSQHIKDLVTSTQVGCARSTEQQVSFTSRMETGPGVGLVAGARHPNSNAEGLLRDT
jgi:hypothetical protein